MCDRAWLRIHVSMTDDSAVQVVLGAGPVGRAVVERLEPTGVPIRVVTRSGRARVPAGVEVVAADVSNEEEACRACAGAAVVTSCVGMGYGGWAEAWPPLMRGMLAGAEAAGARFVFTDNLYMYGPHDGPLTEDCPLTDYGSKPAVRAELTRLWQRAHEAGRVEAVAVRGSDFYGPGVTMSALGDVSFGRIARGRSAQCLGDVDLPHSYTYVPDFARALVTLGEASSEAMGTAWHVPNAPARSTREVLVLFARAVNRDLKVSAMPPWLLSVLGVFVSDLRELKEMMYEWTAPYVVDHSKFAERFWADATSLEDGTRATAAWYLAQSA